MTAIMVAAGIAAEEIARRVAIRIERRDAWRRSSPVEIMSFLGQAALYWMIGGRVTMIDQLRYVLGVCRLPNVHLRVLPFAGGWQPALDGQFMVLDRTIVHADAGRSGIFLHNPADVRSYLDAVDKVSAVAYGEAESRDLLAARLRELEKHDGS